MRRVGETILILALWGLAGWAGAASGKSLGDDLVKAAGKGNLAKVRELMSQGASSNAQDKDGHSALLRAAQEGRSEVARVLLEAGADPNLADKDGKTPLWEATRHDKAEVVALLIQHKADLERADKDGLTPLLQAVGRGNAEVVDQLLDAGADPRPRGRRTLLMAAGAGGSGEVVRRVLELGGDVDAEDVDGETALFYAARSGKGGAVLALIAAHARIDRFSRSRLTPLMAAAQAGNGEGVHALLRAGVDPEVRNDLDRGWTALMYAAKSGSPGASEVIGELAEARAYVNVEDTAHDMPIHIAARQGSDSALRELITRGSDVNRRGSDRKTPLEIVVENNDRDAASALVDAGACVTEAMRAHAAERKDEKMAVILAGGSHRDCRRL